jgi:hypothetical protein
MNRKDNFADLHTLKQSDIIDYFSFYTNDGEYITNVATVQVQFDGQFGNLTYLDDEGELVTIPNTDYDFTRESVYVLGVGYLIPGDIVKIHLLDNLTYEVGYGWHTNVSNQTIHSWYLKPVDYNIFTKEVAYKTCSKIITLQKHHLETIEVVEFKKNRSSFYKGGEPTNG